MGYGGTARGWGGRDEEYVNNKEAKKKKEKNRDIKMLCWEGTLVEEGAERNAITVWPVDEFTVKHESCFDDYTQLQRHESPGALASMHCAEIILAEHAERCGFFFPSPIYEDNWLKCCRVLAPLHSHSVCSEQNVARCQSKTALARIGTARQAASTAATYFLL